MVGLDPFFLKKNNKNLFWSTRPINIRVRSTQKNFGCSKIGSIIFQKKKKRGIFYSGQPDPSSELGKPKMDLATPPRSLMEGPDPTRVGSL